MTASEWATVAGGALSLAGLIWGYAFAWGGVRAKLAEHGKSLEQITEAFTRCQQRGTECTASTKVLLETNVNLLHRLQVDFATHKASVHQHHESQSIHTTDEWRRGVMDRFDRVESGFDRKLEAQTDVLIARIEALERLIRNGSGSGK